MRQHLQLHLLHCSISPCLLVSFPSNGKLPPSRQSPRLPSQLISAANSDLSQLHQFCHVCLNDTLSRRSFMLQSNIPHTHSVSLTSTVLGPLTLCNCGFIALFHTVCDMLSTNNFVHVIALDFSKAFDTVRPVSYTHLTLPTIYSV